MHFFVLFSTTVSWGQLVQGQDSRFRWGSRTVENSENSFKFRSIDESNMKSYPSCILRQRTPLNWT